MLVARRRGQQYSCCAINSRGGGGGDGGSSSRFIGHCGTFCQDFADCAADSTAIAAATSATGVASGAGAGGVAVGDFLAAAGVDHIHDPVGRRPGTILVAKICAEEQQPARPAGLRMCVGFQPTLL